MFELVSNIAQNAVIKVIGVGGGGGNAVQHMVSSEVGGVEFICANTDAQALNNMGSRSVLQLGGGITKGLGAGANPDIGRQAALEDRDQIVEMLSGADMVFITAGMGGGTGTGAAPVVAQVAKELGILTVAVVTKPFPFEGRKRMLIAEQGIKELSEHVDSLIIVPNEKLLQVLGKSCTLMKAFDEANDVLKGAVQGISDLIIRPGMINVDFADVRTVMSEMGTSMMGTGMARGENRALEAAEAAVRSPLLEDVDLMGARGILVNITAGLDLGLGEFSDVGQVIEQFASDSAIIVVGTVIDPEMVDDIKVTVVATGLQKARPEETTVKVVSHNRKPDGELDLNQLELPAVHRRKADHISAEKNRTSQRELSGSQQSKNNANGEADSYLDIPTFLRRQAD